MKIRITLTVLFLATFLVVLDHTPAAGQCVNNRYAITVPAGTNVTMGDASALIPFTVSNNPTSVNPITFVHLEFDARFYNISLMNVEPAGWTITQLKNAGQGQTFIEYTQTSGGIAVGGSQVFNVILTGVNDTAFPSANSDVPDTMDAGTEVRNGGCVFTLVGGFPTWQRKALAATISATPLSAGAGGIVRIILTVTNRSTATQTTVRPNPSTPGVTGTSGGGVFSLGPTPASVATLAISASATFEWLYTVSGSGNLQFCDAATNFSGTATSTSVCSNSVSVGNFTAFISVSPSQVVSGQDVTVIMTVTNNGSTTLQNITPTNLTVQIGGTKVSGPSPNKISNLGPGASSTFQWVYTLIGSVGDTFTFSGNATDNNSVNSVPTPAVSNAVSISAYSVIVSPNQVSSGSSNMTFTFTVRNNGGNGLNKIYVNTPTTGFVYSSASGGCSGAWSVSGGGTPRQIRFTTNSDFVPAGGGVCDFSVTYSTVPIVGTNTDYNFIVVIYDTASNNPRGSLGVIVKITTFNITVTANPASIDPNCIANITVVVSPPPLYPPGGTVTFLETAGILNPHTMTTDVNGQAVSVLMAPSPYFAGIPSATITATYQDATGNVTVLFTNVGSCATVKILDWREVVR